jgi:hypothetical protein
MLHFNGKNFIEVAEDSLNKPPGLFIGWMLSSDTAKDLYGFAKLLGVNNIVHPEEMHCTIIYSPEAHFEGKFGDTPLSMNLELNSDNLPATTILGKPGSEGALVTTYYSNILANRHRYWRDEKGLPHSFDPPFLPHVTLSYNAQDQNPGVVKRLIQYPCMIPIILDRERINPAKDF